MSFWQQREAAQRQLDLERGGGRPSVGDRLRVVLAFPNTYHVGMSNLGVQTVHHLFNCEPGVACERVFLPPKQELRALQTSRAPLLSLDTQMPVSDFDVVAFTVSFEWDYVNILTMLRLAGMPIYASERTDRHPLVVLGGAVTFLNPEPLAPFVDVVSVGEGEALVAPLVSAVAAMDRRDALRQLATQPGFYVPSLYGVRYRDDGVAEPHEALEPAVQPFVPKAAVKTIDEIDPPCTRIFTPHTEFGSRFLVEIVRGCAKLCRFCWAGYNYLPVRAFATERILSLAEQAKPYAGRAGLVSIAACDHPDIEEILERLLALGYTVSLASLRLDDLTPQIVELLYRSGERTVTIAPEAGSDRLRQVVNKVISNEQILEKAELIFSTGVENLKLYFMVGLPTETDADLVAIRDLVVRLRDAMLTHARRRGRPGRIIASVNPLVPKPGTSYQWMPMTAPAIVAARTKRLRELLAGLDHVHASIKSERHAFYQALLSLGDRRVAPVIDAASLNGGDWRRAAETADVDPEFWVFRDRSLDPALPWDIIDGGAKDAFFRSEFDKSLRGEPTLPPARGGTPPPLVRG
ncbi:MAG: radical SAM protein [Vicinamibacterales bacterium]|jgi:radical SAM superfamily enzyme YgiQ (UPF0313 family)|nr:radical SAM protein [Acidobacteriota bacterium]MDP7294037.1 radical SAM protein [Vicinamibacterales bacterium]MDP7472439.1 radical SAM protein [Vicinamibacterales bacterium]MDP7671102.1 radical SAM protein [Vicinamibacterales bacterium]HJO39892.1 radical SAM protein [Vicinamibacterales bacterium]